MVVVGACTIQQHSRESVGIEQQICGRLFGRDLVILGCQFSRLSDNAKMRKFKST